MKIKEIMTKNTICIDPTDTLQKAAVFMKDNDIGALPVCENDKLVGMLTDRDIVIRGLASKSDLADLHVREFMSSPIVFCFEDQDTEDVARIMEAKHVRRLVVLDQNKRLVGIASLDDFAQFQALGGEILSQVTSSQRSKFKEAA